MAIQAGYSPLLERTFDLARWWASRIERPFAKGRQRDGHGEPANPDRIFTFPWFRLPVPAGRLGTRKRGRPGLARPKGARRGFRSCPRPCPLRSGQAEEDRRSLRLRLRRNHKPRPQFPPGSRRSRSPRRELRFLQDDRRLCSRQGPGLQEPPSLGRDRAGRFRPRLGSRPAEGELTALVGLGFARARPRRPDRPVLPKGAYRVSNQARARLGRSR